MLAIGKVDLKKFCLSLINQLLLIQKLDLKIGPLSSDSNFHREIIPEFTFLVCSMFLYFSVLIELDPHTECVKLKQLGSNHSGLNGSALVMNQEKLLQHGDIIEVLHNSYKYKVEFDGINSLHCGLGASMVEVKGINAIKNDFFSAH